MNDLGIHPIIAASVCFLTFGIIPLIPVQETFKKEVLTKSSLMEDGKDTLIS